MNLREKLAARGHDNQCEKWVTEMHRNPDRIISRQVFDDRKPCTCNHDVYLAAIELIEAIEEIRPEGWRHPMEVETAVIALTAKLEGVL